MTRADTAPAAAAPRDQLAQLQLAVRRADALAQAADQLASGLATDDVPGRARLATLIELVAIAVGEVVCATDRAVAGVEAAPP